MRAAICLILIAACAGFGYSLVQAEKRRERLVTAMASSLEILKGEITVRLTPLPDCADFLAESGPEEVRGFYVGLGTSMGALGEVEFSRIWSACLRSLDLPGTALDALDYLGRSLGRFDAASQGAAIDRCLAALGGAAGELHEKTRRDARLHMGLSLAAGALLAVILY